MEFEDTTEILSNTCESCSCILVTSAAVSESNGVQRKELSSNERLALLLSEGGLDIRIPQSTFREAIQSGCVICKELYENAIRCNSDGRLSAFCFGRGATDLNAEHGSSHEQIVNVDMDSPADNIGDDLIINFHAGTFEFSDKAVGKEREHGQIPSSCDIIELEVSPLGALERWISSVSFDTFAMANCELPNEADPASECITTRPIDPEMGTNASVEVVRGWIQQCTGSHAHCSAAECIPQLPTRVIDVGGLYGDEGPRLLVTQGKYSQYACLSYCWGGPQPMKLTRANLAQFQATIPFSSLPYSLQDAMWWTRQLGLRYLWIDALCIIQDDEIDKAREITDMTMIYMRAFITLYAAKARTCHSGFRQPSVPYNFQWDPFTRAEIAFPCQNGAGLGTLIAQPTRVYNSSDEWLNSRGWALQENLLSERLLTFGSWQMYWTCQSANFVNGGHMKSFSAPPMRLSEIVFMAAHVQPPNKRAPVYALWLDIVEQYVLRQLSDREDRLPALAGVAYPFQRVLGPDEVYLAGLWLGDMPRCLTWCVSHDDDSKAEHEAAEEIARGPGSWSWTSLQSKVHWRDIEDVPITDDHNTLVASLLFRTKVAAYEIKPRYAEAPLGQVTHARLQLRGIARSFDWEGDEVIFDRPENHILIGDAHIGQPLRYSKHHIALLRSDFAQARVPWSNLFYDETAESERHDENGSSVDEGTDEEADKSVADRQCTFYMGRGTGRLNGKRRRRVVAMPVADRFAVVLERKGSCERETGAEGDETRRKSDGRQDDEVDEEVEYLRVGLLDFDFVNGIDWIRHMTEFFEGGGTRTLWIV